MSEWGRLGLAIGGYLVAGPTGFLVGSVLGCIIFPQKSTSEMPKFDNYPIQTSSKGKPVPMIYGTVRKAANIICLGDLIRYVVEHDVGGGGLFGGEQTVKEVKYKRSFLVSVCRGPAWVRRMWKGKKEISLFEDFTINDIIRIIFGLPATHDNSLFWFIGANNSGIGDLTGEDFSEYKNDACMFFNKYHTGNSQALPNFVFEVSSDRVSYAEAVTPRTNGIAMVDSDFNVLWSTALGRGTQSDTDRDIYGRVLCCIRVSNAATQDPLVLLDKDGNILLGDGDWEWGTAEGDKISGVSYNSQSCAFHPDQRHCYLSIYKVTGGFNVYKFDTVDGSLIWRIATMQNSTGRIEVLSNGDVIVPCSQTESSSRPSKISGTDGDETDFWGSCPSLTGKAESCLLEKYDRVYYISSGGDGNNSIVGYHLDEDDYDNWAPESGHGLADICTDGEYIYCCSYNKTSDDKNIWKLTYDLQELASGSYYVSGKFLVSCFIDSAGYFTVVTENGHFVRFNPETLEFVSSTSSGLNVSYTGNPTASRVPAWAIGEPFDEYPPVIVRDLALNHIGLPSDKFDEDSYEDVLEYCVENDIKISVIFDEQKPWYDHVDWVCSHCGMYRYWSGGKFCLGIFKEETPVATVDQDSLAVGTEEHSAPPVQVKKRKYTETFNRVEVTWTDRDNGYTKAVAVAQDEVDQRVSGQIRKTTINLEGITNADLALKMAYRILIDSLYRLSLYTFSISYSKMLLEVNDVITLNDGGQINDIVRITSISEDVNGRWLNCEAIEDKATLYPAISFSTQQTEREPEPAISLVNSTIYFREDENEPHLYLSIVPGNEQVNGWNIYRSYDGEEYKFIGRATIEDVIEGMANSAGTIQSNLPAHTAVVWCGDESVLVSIGTVTDLDIDITDQLFFNNHKLMRIGNEIIAYKTCVETDTEGIWRITGLIRGLFGTEPVAHSSGETFYTLDNDFLYVYRAEDIGQTLYFKAVVFYGDESQELEDATEYTHTIQGLYQRPYGASLLRLQSDENEMEEAEYSGSSFTLYWNLPGARGTGFNQGGYDVNPDWPVWRYGDDEAYLISENGRTYDNYIADDELQAIVLQFEETDGTPIGNREVSATDESATISFADDLDSNSSAVIKVIPRRAFQSIAEHELEVNQV